MYVLCVHMWAWLLCFRSIAGLTCSLQRHMDRSSSRHFATDWVPRGMVVLWGWVIASKALSCSKDGSDRQLPGRCRIHLLHLFHPQHTFGSSCEKVVSLSCEECYSWYRCHSCVSTHFPPMSPWKICLLGKQGSAPIKTTVTVKYCVFTTVELSSTCRVWSILVRANVLHVDTCPTRWNCSHVLSATLILIKETMCKMFIQCLKTMYCSVLHVAMLTSQDLCRY